ncbi:MAG: SAM-dependent methyltransferase [Lachnospiraceae bacterium]|nr:SAM-dependent methyltransferase [Lachnospiraceae bacterium]
MILLSKRLEDIAAACEGCDVLIDIGCDHGLIPVSLLQKDSIRFAVASDINTGPLESAKRNAFEAGVSGRMRFVVSDGLAKIDLSDQLFSGKKTTLLISGMGGPLIEKIINEGGKKIEGIGNFVFSPHSKLADFRKYLGRSGFFIRNERLTKDEGKYYFIISCIRGEDACKDEQGYELGPGFFCEKSIEKAEYLKFRLNNFRDLSDNKNIKGDRRQEIEYKLRLYEKALREYEA